jgi:hypothetical protein
MRKCLRATLVLALPLAFLASCGTDPESGSPVDTSLELSRVIAECPAEISELIAELFPDDGLRQTALLNCGQIFTELQLGMQDDAVQKAFRFFTKTLKQNEQGKLLDPAPSAEAKISDLFTEIFAGIGFDFPVIPPEVIENGEYATGELVPDGDPLITISRHAGIDDNGALLGPVSVFIVQIPADENGLSPSSESHPCPAGVDSSFDCYPLFFDYAVFPESNVNSAIGLKVGQCNVSPPDVEIQLLTPEGFLPELDAPIGLDCTDVVPEFALTGWRKLAWAVLEPISPLFSVTPAFAGKNPIGGAITSFSPVAPADPNSGNGDPPPPPPGTDIVVFNDVNVFDDTAMASPDNELLVQNLVNFTTGKPRDAGTEVWIDCRAPVSGGLHGCANSSTFQTTIESQDLSLIEIFEGSLDELPSEVKVLILWIPSISYTTAEINAFKQFAAEGGRIIFVGEHEGFYGPFIPAQNAFLEALGAVLRNSGGLFDCGYVELPASSIGSHQITGGLNGLTIACSSEIVLGPHDFPLYRDTSGTHVLSGVATIDTTPIEELAGHQPMAAPTGVPPPKFDPVGRPVSGGSW